MELIFENKSLLYKQFFFISELTLMKLTTTAAAYDPSHLPTSSTLFAMVFRESLAFKNENYYKYFLKR